MYVKTRETCQFFWKVLRQIRRIDVIFFADLFIHSLFYRNAAELHYRYEMCFCGKGVGVKKAILLISFLQVTHLLSKTIFKNVKI